MTCVRRTEVVGTGDIVLINPGEIHSAAPMSEDSWSYVMLYVDPALVHAAARRANEARRHTQSVPHFRTPTRRSLLTSTMKRRRAADTDHVHGLEVDFGR